MNISKAIDLFNLLLKDAKSKRETRAYKRFYSTLSSLKSKEFSTEQILKIEANLQELNLSLPSENKGKYYRKKHNEFLKFLKDKFSLTPEGHYTAIGMSLGMCFGLALGSVFNSSGTSMGLAIGMFIGLIIGRLKDQEAEKNNKVLKNH
jgi:hypothetical protein